VYDDLAGYRVIVTGGGTGIGAACAEQLAASGAVVTICGRTEATLGATADRINAAGHTGTVSTVVADVTSESDVERLVQAVSASDGTLDGVVANAGGGGAIAPYHLQQLDEFVRVLHLNVVGTMLLVKHTVSLLVASGRGSFVAMSSIAGHLTHPYFGAYAVAKAGLEEMMRNAADEYGPANVRFNAVRPGFTATELMQAIPPDSAIYESYITNTPLQGIAEPEDVARLVAFLLGPGARWITGQIINVDGGHALRRGPDFSSFLEPILGWDALLARSAPTT
jgi:NAD(P)-dependent dehydrogenase (short-subunit alcohol dehydrogenase family)